MCCGGKCLLFISLRTGSLIFGYITAIISGLGTIVCTGFAMYFGILLMFPDYKTITSESVGRNFYSSYSVPDYLPRYLAAEIIIFLYFIEFLSGFICSVLLLVGITQNKASLVKTFIVYGMLQVVLLMTFFIMLHCARDFFVSGYVLLAAGILGVYSTCVYMVFLTYQAMTQHNVYGNPLQV